jgi:hypothetical protein
MILTLLGPVVMKGQGGCEEVDEVETCMSICKIKTGRRPFRVETLGRTGADRWRVCACYTTRQVVVDDLPAPAEKESR